MKVLGSQMTLLVLVSDENSDDEHIFPSDPVRPLSVSDSTH